MHIVSNGDNVHELSNPVFLEKYEKYFNSLLLKILPRVLSINAKIKRFECEVHTLTSSSLYM